MSNLKHNGRLRWTPSYLRNQGQLTKGQKRALQQGWKDFGIVFRHGEMIDLNSAFETEGPLLIEIGFGMGDHLVHLAKHYPNHRILGIEVHRPGLAAATGKLQSGKIENVRLIRGDARLVISDYLPPHLAEAVFIQFPEPWSKEGKTHRRLIQPEMLDLLHRCLIPRGECFIITDMIDYATHCAQLFDTSSQWQKIERSPFEGSRVLTKYEEKALREGREITELCYRTKDGNLI
ncbi:MAG: tRNA (guanosine(46)-N7)-methyltransferase TrmB [Verrucomicrobiales bacterium]|nr:tRNA (guanosine(46)-N7)-methyltransferase TrmB [Verrucomicrobiales bacterium]